MTFDVDSKWSITVWGDKLIGPKEWSAYGDIFRRGTEERVETLTGCGETRQKAIDDATEKAENRVLALSHL